MKPKNILSQRDESNRALCFDISHVLQKKNPPLALPPAWKTSGREGNQRKKGFGPIPDNAHKTLNSGGAWEGPECEARLLEFIDLCMLNLYTLVSGIIISYNGIIHTGQRLQIKV